MARTDSPDRKRHLYPKMVAVSVVALGLAMVPKLAFASTAATPAHAKPKANNSVLTILEGTNASEDLNPYNGLEATYLMYESLEFVNAYNGKFTPLLATGYTAPNSETVIFHIRSGVKWSNGTAFTPADVVFTFDMLKKYTALDSSGVWSYLRSVSASGQNVIFRFKMPAIALTLDIAQVPIVPESVWSHVSNPVKFLNQHPVVTGPYTLDSYSTTEIKLKKDAKSWQASVVRPEYVELVAGPSSSAAQALAITEGDYDAAYDSILEPQTTYVDRSPKYNHYWYPAGGIISLDFNLTEAPFNNLYVRRGISEALDRQSLGQEINTGLPKSLGAAPQTGLMLPNDKQWLDPGIPNDGMISQNHREAMADFAKAGYRMKGGKLVNRSGQQLSFGLMIPSGYSWLAGFPTLEAQLDKVGIATNLVSPESAQWNTDIYTGHYQATLTGFGGAANLYLSYDPALASQFATPVGVSTVNNFERFKFEGADRDLSMLAGATTLAAQKKATYGLEEIVYNRIPFITICYGANFGLFSTRHWVGWPSAKNPYTLPQVWNYGLLAFVMHVRPA